MTVKTSTKQRATKPAIKGKTTTKDKSDLTTVRAMIGRLTAENADLQGKLTAAEGALQEYKAALRPFLVELQNHRQGVINLSQVSGQQVYLQPFAPPTYAPIPDLEEGGDQDE